jgi:putative flavoprotein involved in K+ transport
MNVATRTADQEFEGGAQTTRLDVLVIGAGQAGLAAGYHLRGTGLRFRLVERHARIGDSWRERFDSLALFTPRAYSHLPGLLLDGDQEGYATRDEVADYLERYAAEFQLPVRHGAAITSLERVDGRFIATSSDGMTVEARAVIVASGAFAVPAVPAFAERLSTSVKQLTPVSYRNPSSVPTGTVLVVGDGATGRQIALELAGTHRVLLATGKKRTLGPRRLAGRSIYWWMDRLGLLDARPTGRIGRRLRARDAFPGRHLSDKRLKAAGVELVARVTSADGASITVGSGDVHDVDAVVWATGYRDDTSWARIPGAVSDAGSFVESDGDSPIPNLSFVGRPWQMRQSSALLTGVGGDAQVIVDRVARTLAVSSPLEQPPATFSANSYATRVDARGAQT